MNDVIRQLALKMQEELSRSEVNILIYEKYLQQAYEMGKRNHET